MSSLDLWYSKQYKKDFKKAQKQGKDLEKLRKLLGLLIKESALPSSCREHKLIGNWADHWECHIAPDWLLIYKKEASAIVLVRLGSHSDLFN